MSPIWSAEGAEKVLSTAAAYRPLLLAGLASLVRGSTTDTLWVVGSLPGSASGDETAVLNTSELAKKARGLKTAVQPLCHTVLSTLSTHGMALPRLSI